MEFIINQKGCQSLIWNGSRFTLNRKMNNVAVNWRCSKWYCPARLTTQGDELLQQTAGHNHAIDLTECCLEQIKSKLHRKRVGCPSSGHLWWCTSWTKHSRL